MLKKKCVQRKVRFSSSYSAPGCLFLKERSRGNIFHDLFQIYSGEYIRNRASSHDLVTFFWAIASKVNLTSSGLWQAISSATFVNVTLTDAFFSRLCVAEHNITSDFFECTMHLAKAISAPRSQQQCCVAVQYS